VYSEKNGHTKKGVNYSYFGARYYDSDLSVWLSVDPMSDMYPHQSPYMYCSGSPINRIDPTGESDSEFDDIYSVDTDGNVKLEKKTNDNYDVVYKKADYDKGNLNNGQKVSDKNILPNLSKNGVLYKVPDVRDAVTGEWTYNNLTRHEACSNNSTDMISLFVFLANASTNAEWRLSKNVFGEFNLSTFHDPFTSPNDGTLGLSTKSISWMIHSHPKARSGGEVAGMDGDRTSSLSYPAYYVYTPQSGYLFKLPNSRNSNVIHRGQSNGQVQYFLNLLK